MFERINFILNNKVMELSANKKFVLSLLLNNQQMCDDFVAVVEEWNCNDEDLEVLSLLSNYVTVPRVSIINYFEEIVPQYSDEEFIRNYRLSRDVFQELVSKYSQSTYYLKISLSRQPVSPSKTLAVFLWFAGHEACSYRDLSDRFNLSLSTVHAVIRRGIAFISSLAPSVIKWPNDDEISEEVKYHAKPSTSKKCYSIPGVVGCIDGSHIVIDPPARNKDDYINRKGTTSIILQAVCNHEKKFIDFFVGFPGSVHDSRVFTNSPLQDILEHLPPGTFLLGDSGYPCRPHLLTPYKDNGHLTDVQKEFNKQLSSCRVIIEHSFGLLKQRFRQLYYCKLRTVKILCHFIRACGVLHNLSSEGDADVFKGETNPEQKDDTNATKNQNQTMEEDEYVYSEVDTTEGQQLRDQVANHVFRNGTRAIRNAARTFQNRACANGNSSVDIPSTSRMSS